MGIATLLASLAPAYLIGGVPTAYIVGRVFRDIDIREHGSGNVGTTNAWRVLGARAGITVLVLDVLKGALAVLVAESIGSLLTLGAGAGLATAAETLPVLAALCAILGHTYTPFLGFNGGKGIATAAGALLVVTPLAVATLVALFAVIVALTRMVSAGSVIVALLYPVMVALLYADIPGAFPLAVAAAAVVLWRHKANIARIARGEERRIGRPGKPDGRGAAGE